MKKMFVAFGLVLLLVVLCFGRNVLYQPVQFQEMDNSDLVFNGDESLVATTVRGDGVHLWETTSGGRHLRRLQNSDGAKPLGFAPGEEFQLLAVEDDELVIYRDYGKQSLDSRRTYKVAKRAEYTNDGELIAIQHRDIRPSNGPGESYYDVVTVTTEWDTREMLRIENASAFAWCQHDLLAVGVGNHVELWDANANVMLVKYPEQEGKVRHLIYRPGEQKVYSLGSDGSLYLWDTSPSDRDDVRANRYIVEPGPSSWFSIWTDSENRLCMASANDSGLRLWRFESGNLVRYIPGNRERSEHERFRGLSPHGNYCGRYALPEKGNCVLHLEPIKWGPAEE
jgi:WD40 repeat protein